MGTLTEFQYNFLSNIEQKALEIVNPYTVILNPDSKKLLIIWNKERREEVGKNEIDCAEEKIHWSIFR